MLFSSIPPDNDPVNAVETLPYLLRLLLLLMLLLLPGIEH